ncbi:hypothetical protein MLD38_025788 [Melastoma candidum]|uniref:Uncharacterized protein n=1 Tax=Melastoma candidum TaxID=119954 RepID=A0ACB9NXE4_9MYRT|nr:hypothetical protein MLD38_025788 [Melastoma candidum]
MVEDQGKVTHKPLRVIEVRIRLFAAGPLPSSLELLLRGRPMATINLGGRVPFKTASWGDVNRRKPCLTVRSMCVEKPLEELYNLRVERKVSKERLEELGVSRWSVWKTGKCQLPWDWHVDQLVYIEEGEVRVVPSGSRRYMSFLAGDLVRYPKWFEADLFFNAPYRERYSFRAYGDD